MSHQVNECEREKHLNLCRGHWEPLKKWFDGINLAHIMKKSNHSPSKYMTPKSGVAAAPLRQQKPIKICLRSNCCQRSWSIRWASEANLLNGNGHSHIVVLVFGIEKVDRKK
jgi:hypothetical protein